MRIKIVIIALIVLYVVMYVSVKNSDTNAYKGNVGAYSEDLKEGFDC